MRPSPARRPLVAAVLLSVLAACAPARSQQPPAESPLAPALDALAAARKIDSAEVGWQVVRLSDGAILAERAAHTPRRPASNVKLFTTAAALIALGADFQFETYLLRRGDVVDGVLNGELIVVGSGDPNISGRFHDGNPVYAFEQWAAALKKAGIRRVRGNLVCDDTRFDRTLVHPTWPADQLEEWYCAEVGALTLNDNCLDVTVVPAAGKSRSGRVTCSPSTAYASITNKTSMTASRKAHSIVFARATGTNRITVSGKVWTKAAPFTSPITIHDPTLFFGHVAKETFARCGVAVEGAVTRSEQGLEKTDPAAAVAAKWASPIGTTIQVANQRSQNLYAECLMKAMGAATRKSGTWENGCAAVEDVARLLGCAGGEVALVDGSGLSKDNRASPAATCALLAGMVRRKEARLFLDSLAVSGTSGSLDDRLKEAPYRGAVRGKTGTIAGVSCLSGYICRPDGTPVLAFSIMTNGWKGGTSPVKDFEDAACARMVDWVKTSPPPDRPAK